MQSREPTGVSTGAIGVPTTAAGGPAGTTAAPQPPPPLLHHHHHQQRSYSASAAVPPSLPNIPPVSPGLHQQPHLHHQPPNTSRSIPSIDELRSASSRGLTRLNAPNLTTYIEHYRKFYFLIIFCLSLTILFLPINPLFDLDYYHFAGNCTVYQAPEGSRHTRSVQIVAERQSSAPSGAGGNDAPSGATFTPVNTSTAAGGTAAGPSVPPPHHGYNLPQPPPPYSHPLPTSRAIATQPLPAVSTLAASAANVRLTPMVGELFGDDGRLKRTLGSTTFEHRSVKRTRPLSLSAADMGRRAEARSSSARATSSHSPPGGASNSSSLSRSPSRRRSGPESELMMNDWEHVVQMYLTGEGTPDGRPLRDITRGDGRRVEDRKLLEKRRTIGKTYERLGKELFERSIGYKMDGKYRRKQKMYHVIARCRIVNGLRKAGEPLPTDAEQLTALIDQRLIEKANAGAATRAEAVRRIRPVGTSGVVGGTKNDAPILSSAPPSRLLGAAPPQPPAASGLEPRHG